MSYPITKFSHTLWRAAQLFLPVTLMAFSFLSSSSDAASLQLDKGQFYPLSGHLEILTDPSGQLSFADILAPSTAARFTHLPSSLSKSYSRDTVWLRFTMIRTSAFPEDAWLRLGPPYLDYVTVYLQTGGNATEPTSYREVRLGDHIPAFERPVQHPEFVTPVQLPLDRPVTVFVRVKTTSSLNLSGAIHTTPNIIRYNTTAMMLHGGYLGIALVIALVNLIYFLRVGDRLFLYFSVYIFIMFWNHMGTEGIITIVWPSQAHRVSDYLVGMALGALVLSFSPFAMQLFATTRRPWAHRYFWFMAIIGVVTMISVPLGFYGSVAPLTIIGTLGTIVVLFWLSFLSVKNGEPAGMLYLTAFGVSNIGYVVQFLRLLGVLPLAWWNSYSVQVASLINMVLMTLALTERLRIAEEKAVVAARDSEQRAVALAEDMTVEIRNKQADLELALANEQQAVEIQKRFLAMLSHEYRTPLAIIQANLDLLELQEAESGSCHEPRLTTMKHAISRLVEVMEVSLQKERFGNAETVHPDERINLVPFLDKVIDSAESLWPGRSFIFQPEALSESVVGDAGLLKTALLNLLDNAIKFSAPDTPVLIEFSIENEIAAIAIRDQGIGITAADARIVFEKYQRGSNSHDTSGAGLGLWLVQQIVQQHGGSVTLTPGEKSGAAATLRLPISKKNIYQN